MNITLTKWWRWILSVMSCGCHEIPGIIWWGGHFTSVTYFLILSFLLLSFLFFFFFGHAYSMRRFLGRGSNPCLSMTTLDSYPAEPPWNSYYILSKTYNLSLIMRKISAKSTMGTFYKWLAGTPWDCQSHGKQNSRNCHRPEATGKTWQLNAMWYCEAAPGRGRGP